MRSTTPVDTLPFGPGNSTSCLGRPGLTRAEPIRFPLASNPIRHLVMTVAHLAAQMALDVAFTTPIYSGIKESPALVLAPG